MTEAEDETTKSTGTSNTTAPARAFGTENRARLLTEYFNSVEAPSPDSAWQHVYRLLLWTDRTTGLAHCYESDKSQPGRPWYARSLAFHVWVASALMVDPSELGEHIDLLFRRAALDLASASAGRRAKLTAQAALQREPYVEMDLPLPGEDPELEAILTESLGPYLSGEPSREALRDLAEKIQAHVGQENKRKNLVGEGFEDTLAAVLQRTDRVSDTYDVLVRPWLHDIPGFHRPRGSEKAKQVDLALVRRSDGYRVLISCKWSIRSDREEQFASDFQAYAQLESSYKDFDYVLVTNEFDPARLTAACENRQQSALLFSDVVHVNPDGPTAAYEAPGLARRAQGGLTNALQHIDSGRLSGLSEWIRRLQA